MKKNQIKNGLIFISIFVFMMLGISFIAYFLNNPRMLYSEKSYQFIKDNKLIQVLKSKYSKTLDKIIKSDNYKEQYLDTYLQIDYINTTYFPDKVNSYLDIGYDADTINQIFKLSESNQNKLLSLPKQPDFTKYLNISNFDIENLERYESYLKQNNLDLSMIVTKVNIGLDRYFYQESTMIDNPDAINTLVNKYHYLDSQFIPKDLVTLFDSQNGAKMVKEAAIAYQQLILDAKQDNIILESTTAYRDYNFQSNLYNNYVKKDGIDLANTYSAKPGYSEHQLGLAVDLNDPFEKNRRLSDQDYEWLLNNSYKYGFIVRYPKNKENITGYQEEPWHIRYLGIDLATNVYNSKLTYDEYYDLYIIKH